jgi:hypothetical protein
MNENCVVSCESDKAIEDVAARLTVTAYRVALRHAARDTWIDLELDLWRELTDAVETCVQESRRVSGQPEAVDGAGRNGFHHCREVSLRLPGA